ncbi:MAG: M15 family metallopeptidase [Gaiellaceae bacterium]
MIRLAAALFVVTAAVAAAAVHPLPPRVQRELTPTFWHNGCPVPMSSLRLLTVPYLGFDRQRHTGELIVNADVAAPLARVFRKLYALHFPIRHMVIQDYYGPKPGRPLDTDVSESFECRQASASPCGGIAPRGTGHWSEHAYGHAVDLNPVENPYVGCGQSRDPRAKPYFDRSHLRRGMVTPAVVAAFRSVGWGWGGSWSGDTKDYMHFSASGH